MFRLCIIRKKIPIAQIIKFVKKEVVFLEIISKYIIKNSNLKISVKIKRTTSVPIVTCVPLNKQKLIQMNAQK